ncbi:hypothetical protein HMPREF3198_02172 [Winkia neuii]|nr:hypothetical protein HMPREF3198_02172 [Winkia neuii]
MEAFTQYNDTEHKCSDNIWLRPLQTYGVRPVQVIEGCTVSDSPTQNVPTQNPQAKSTDPAETAAREFGRVSEDGTVWVKDADGERAVGQFPDKLPEDPLSLYVRRFLDLQAQVELFEGRLPHLNSKEIDQTLSGLQEAVREPAVVGNVQALRERVAQLAEKAGQAKEAAKERRAAQKAEALSRRIQIVEEAEAVAAQDPARTQWKHSSQKLRDLLEQWKGEQRKGPRLDRPTEDGLWKRFSGARTVFDRHRRQFFSKLDASQAEAKKAKQDLVRRAEELSTSTDWGATAGAYRDLMNEWRRAGRASRKDDDALWERFRKAQQTFFDAKNAQNAALEQEFQQNLALKEKLLEKVEAILPVTDIEAAKAKLRPLQDEWDQIGHVPRADKSRIESRMRAVEDAIRKAEEDEWRRTDPETKARAQGMLGQLQTKLEDLSQQIDAAKAAGNTQELAKLQEAYNTSKQWFDQISPQA